MPEKVPKKRGAGCDRGCNAGFESIRVTGFANVLYEEGNVVGMLVRPQDYKPQGENLEVNISVRFQEDCGVASSDTETQLG